MEEQATLVLIDDNPGVLELCEQTLREAGYHVLATTDPVEAARIMHTISVDLVVGTAAGLDGFRIERGGPKLLRLGEPGLRLPFTLAELRDAVADALAFRPRAVLDR